MKDTIRNTGLRKAMFGALTFVIFQLGCTSDQLVANDRGNGDGTPDIQLGAGDDSDGDQGGESAQDGGGQAPGGDGVGVDTGDPAEIGGEIGGIEEPVACGRPSTVDLTAGQDMKIGSVMISNDAENLFVTFETKGGWLLGTTHVHIGDDVDDVPMTTDGKPIPGQFEYSHPHEDGDAGVKSVVFVIPLAELDRAGKCSTSIHVWTHANSLLVDRGGTIVQQESGWGGDMAGTGSAAWSFLTSYDLVCCD